MNIHFNNLNTLNAHLVGKGFSAINAAMNEVTKTIHRDELIESLLELPHQYIYQLEQKRELMIVTITDRIIRDTVFNGITVRMDSY